MEQGSPMPHWRDDRWTMMQGLRVRIAVSIMTGVGWLSFVLLYAAFWTSGFSLFQSIVIVLVSALIAAGIMGAMWASWGMRFAR